MNRITHGLVAFFAAAAMQASLIGIALAQGNQPGAEPVNPPPPGYNAAAPGQAENQPGPSQPGSSAAQTPSTVDLPVLYLTSVEVLRTATEPHIDIVRVTGLSGSQGWSGPELVPTIAGKPLDGILDLQFIAAEPVQSQPAEGFVPISAVFTLEESKGFKGVRVRASENALEVTQIPGHVETAIKVDGCKDCVGKKFAERGKAAPGTPGVVRQEDLPKTLRWITPTHGIRGITHNPNRLNLMLGPDNTIIAAYWE